MSVISVINHKGGVAKTTTAVNVASSWARLGKRVLLVDLDPQASATHAIFGKQEFDHTVYDVIVGQSRINESIVHSPAYGIDVLPSELMLSGVDIQVAAQYGRERILKRALDSIKRIYDAVIIDCSPSLGLLTVNALLASDEIIIPICPEYFSVKGIELIMNTIDNIRAGLGHKVEVKGIVITRFRSRNVVKKVMEDLKKTYAFKVFDSFIPDNVAIEEAHHNHLPVAEYAPRSKGSIAYNKLSKEILNWEN